MNMQIGFIFLCAVLHRVAADDLSFVDVLKNFNTGEIQQMKEKFEANPLHADLTMKHKQAIAAMIAHEGHGGSSKRLLQTANVVEAFKNPVVSDAWKRIRAPYPSDSIIRTSSFGGKDKIKVEKIGSICYITGQETNEGSDWFENLSSGKLEIKDTNNGADIGSGHPGFVGPYNDIRVQLKNLITSKCGGTTSKRYVGYSRGGAIMQVVLYAHLKAGIATASKSTLVTFGSPRALLEDESNFVHNALGSRGHRVVNEGDPVPTAPPGWFGWPYGSYYTHVGANAYGLSRNGPTFLSRYNFNRHTQYDPSFANFVDEGEVKTVFVEDGNSAIVAGVAGTLVVVASALVVVSHRRARAAETLATELQEYMNVGRNSSARLSSFNTSRQISLTSSRQSSIPSFFRTKQLPLATDNPLRGEPGVLDRSNKPNDIDV